MPSENRSNCVAHARATIPIVPITPLLATVAALGGLFAALGCDRAPDQEATEEVSSALSTPDSAEAGRHELLRRNTQFFIPAPQASVTEQITSLLKKRAYHQALQIGEMAATPRAVWVVGGSPAEATKQVAETMASARRAHRVPILVAYNLPYRDCVQYSSGGALDTAAYQAWIDGFAKGIHDDQAIVILEPDGLGLIPYNTALDGTSEWCRPTVVDAQGQTVPAPGASPEARYAQLNYAVASLKNKAPNALVYLNGTHSAWLGTGEIAFRLVKAGVLQTRGFFLNVSNYRPTPQEAQYGAWIAKCIYFANNPAEGGWRLGHYDYCANQYYPATASDPTTWSLTDQWYADNVDNATNPPTGSAALKHFVIDTGRNGQGPLKTAPYASAPYNQPATALAGLNGGNWCNAFGAGLGVRTTADTGLPLADAYLWVKVPGESDGTCDIAGGARA
ncbi:MAG TPA: glycoside hydrolase family 6 protein, partial [Polyangia bacterium]